MEWMYENNGEEWISPSTNIERADWAEAAVQKFREVCRGDNDMTAIVDLIANMGHLFDRVMAEHDTDYPDDYTFRDAIDSALNHYDAETGEGDDIEQAERAKRE